VVVLLVLHVCHHMAAVHLIENLSGLFARLHMLIDALLVFWECFHVLVGVVSIYMSLKKE